jgi:thiamine kinase-like enzyme
METLLPLGWSTGGQAKGIANPFQYHDMIAIYRNALHHLEWNSKDDRMNALLQILSECVNALSCEWKEHGGSPPQLPPVLCHMDLQPQNLAFQCNSRSKVKGCDNGNGKQTHNHTARHCCVASVMDWEEACYADPRFELLLVCRKVLANREQAEKLWQSYSNRVEQLSRQLNSQSKKTMSWNVGPLEPWLKLETVHSLCTLMLQAMDLPGGGRSPWETKPDLWGKIDRERQRLVQMGWHFCRYSKNAHD